MLAKTTSTPADRRLRTNKGAIAALVIYLLAFIAPAAEGDWFRGLGLFQSGFFLLLDSGGRHHHHLLACWAANFVFWIALVQALAGGRRGALLGAALAVALASIPTISPLRDMPVIFHSPAYWLWFGSMAWLFLSCFWVYIRQFEAHDTSS